MIFKKLKNLKENQKINIKKELEDFMRNKKL